MSGPTPYAGDGKELFTEERPAVVILGDLLDYIQEMRKLYDDTQELYQVLQDNLSFIGSGSPKGVYPTLIALQTAKPTGDNFIYVVTENGNWYYWNGSAWTSGGVYQAKFLEAQSVTPRHLSPNIIESLMAIDSLTKIKNLYSVFSSGYKRASIDTGLAPETGVFIDYPANPSSYNPETDVISIQKNDTVATYTELVIGNADLLKIKNDTGFTYSMNITPIQNSSPDIVIQIHSVTGNSATLIYEKNYGSLLVNNSLHINAFLEKSLIPNNAECLRLYIRQGDAFVSSSLNIEDLFLQLGNTVGMENIEKTKYPDIISETIGLSSLKNKVENISSEFTQTELSFDRLFSSLMTYTLENGVLSALTKNDGVSNTHPFVLFPEDFSELVFTHIRNNDWIYIGGDDTKGTAISIGTPRNIRLIDLGATNGQVVDITIPDIANINDRIHFKWMGDTFIARKNNGTGWADWFTVNMKLYGQLQHYKVKKRFGAMTDTSNIPLMKDVSATTGEPSLIDRVVQLENNRDKSKEGDTWNAVGDSITQNGLYIPKVENALGLIATNYGLSSSTLAVNNRYLQNKSVVERLNGLNGNTPMKDADLWTIFAGVNDWLYETPVGTMASTDQTTFYGALKAVVENVLQRPNHPKLILFTPLQSNRNGANNVGVTMEAYRQAIKEVGDYYSVPVLDLYGIGGFNPINLSRVAPDGVHPNEEGTNLYYTKIVNEIRKL